MSATVAVGVRRGNGWMVKQQDRRGGEDSSRRDETVGVGVGEEGSEQRLTHARTHDTPRLTQRQGTVLVLVLGLDS